MAISGIYGLPGKGKSFFSIYYAASLANKYEKKIVSNFWFNPDAFAYYAKINNYRWLCDNIDKGIIYFVDSNKNLEDILSIKNSVTLLDEAGIYMPARDYTSTPKKLLIGLYQSRKLSQDLIYTCQFPSQVDVVLREMTAEVFYCSGATVYDAKLKGERLVLKNMHYFGPEQFTQWYRDPKLRKNPMKTRILANKSWTGFPSAMESFIFQVYDSFTELDKQDQASRVASTVDALNQDTKYQSSSQLGNFASIHKRRTKPKKHQLAYVPEVHKLVTTEAEAKLGEMIGASNPAELSQDDWIQQILTQPAVPFPSDSKDNGKQAEYSTPSYHRKNGGGQRHFDPAQNSIPGVSRDVTFHVIKGHNRIKPHKYQNQMKFLYDWLPDNYFDILKKVDMYLTVNQRKAKVKYEILAVQTIAIISAMMMGKTMLTLVWGAIVTPMAKMLHIPLPF